MKPSSGGAEPLQDLIRRLEQSRNRLKGRMFLYGLFWSIAIALSIFVFLGLFRFAVASLVPALAFDHQVSLWGGLLIFLVGCVWTLGRLHWGNPSLAELARRADAHFNLQERASAAFEVHARGTSSVVDEALLYDAARWGNAIEPRELIPITLPRSVWYLLTLVGLTLALQLLLPLPLSTEPIPTLATEASLEDEELDQTSAKVHRVAELVAQNAEAKHDPYLRAIAHAFDDLGAKIERGELNQAEVERELSRLLGHLGRALGEGTDAAALFAPAAAPRSESLAGSASNPETEIASDQQGISSAADFRPARAKQAAQDKATLMDTSLGKGDATATLDEVLARLGARLQPPDQEASGERQQLPNFTGDAQGITDETSFYADAIGNENWQQQRLRDKQGLAGQGRPAGIPVGAEDAGRGEGDLAGEGVRPLAGEVENDEDSDLPELGFEGVQLPASKRDSGRRITVDIPPEATLSSVSAAQGDEGGAWHRYNEVPVAGNVISTLHREVVSRYFMPQESTAVEGQP